MSKLIRIDEECESILRKYSEGSMSDCIRAMEAKATTHVTVSSGITIEEFRKEMEKLKEGIRNTNAEFMKYLSSGQGAIQLPEIKGDTFIGRTPGNEFRRASLREEK